jgi:hypothetical protein
VGPDFGGARQGGGKRLCFASAVATPQSGPETFLLHRWAPGGGGGEASPPQPSEEIEEMHAESTDEDAWPQSAESAAERAGNRGYWLRWWGAAESAQRRLAPALASNAVGPYFPPIVRSVRSVGARPGGRPASQKGGGGRRWPSGRLASSGRAGGGRVSGRAGVRDHSDRSIGGNLVGGRVCEIVCAIQANPRAPNKHLALARHPVSPNSSPLGGKHLIGRRAGEPGLAAQSGCRPRPRSRSRRSGRVARASAGDASGTPAPGSRRRQKARQQR